MKRRTAWLSLAILFLTFAAARDARALDPATTLSQYIHRIWQTQQGLPQASIYAIVQTRDGYLWLGTQTGLVKFDGVRFTAVDELGGVKMSGVWVTHLLEDAQGALWIGTAHEGVIRLLGHSIRRFSDQDGLPSSSVQCLFDDARGNVWACTTAGIAEIGSTDFSVSSPRPLAGQNVVAACEGPGHVMLAATSGSEISSSVDGGPFTRTTWSLPPRVTVQSVLCATDSSVWVGTSNGIFHGSGNQFDRMTVADGLAEASVLTLMESRDGSIFAGTTNGFSRIRGTDIESFRSEDGLSQSTVYAIVEDRESSLWVATKHGLNQFLDGLTIPYTTAEGLPSNSTGPVLQDRHGTVWVGTLGGGLGRYDGHRFTALTTRDGLASNWIYTLAEDLAGNVWVGTAAGLNELRNGRVIGSWTSRNGLPADVVRALYADHDDALWISTPGGTVVMRHGRLRLTASGRSPPDDAIVAFADDSAGNHYAAPDNASPLLHRADTIYEDIDGLMWIGTLGEGLRLFDHGHIFNFSLQDGLFDDVIYGVTADDHGRLWMACSKGIFSVNRKDLLQFAAGRLSHVASTPYSPLDALRTIECQPGVQPVVARMTDGRLWFSTIRGVLVIDPGRLTRHFLPPSVAISEFIVNGEPQPVEAVRTLPPGENNVEFGYTGVSFVAPARMTFRYMLEGFDKRWIDAGPRRQAFYTNLPSGRFRFHVSACNPGGVCAETGQGAGFEIARHYYQRSWFVPLCAGVLALGGWTVYRLRIRRLRDQFDLILAERGRIARELHDTLIQGFSGITMAMQALASRLPSSATRTTLEEIVADAARSLREARRSITGLRSRDTGTARAPAHDGSRSDLAVALAHAARTLADSHNVALQLTLPDRQQRALPVDVEENVLKVAQEAMVNAVRHSGARTLRVKLERSLRRLRLVVADDGRGFDYLDAAPGHYGIVGMKERAAHIDASFELSSQHGKGTTVSLVREVP
jgi:signal transduction histidine kinase/ligand-binding sensor domain-containing protein